MRRVTISFAKDDGFDSGSGNGGRLQLSDVTVDSCHHEGMAFMAGRGPGDKHVTVVDSTVTNCQQGIELGCSVPGTTIDVTRTLVANCAVGIRYGDVS